MLRIMVLEGPRGVGKSTAAQLIRHTIEGATLINLTGFKEDGREGLYKIESYYDALLKYLRELHYSGNTYTVIFDRIFFSEMVYAPKYKSYDFTSVYNDLCKNLLNIADQLDIYFLTISDREELRRRLVRDKVALFGHVEESVEQSLTQQEGYEKIFDEFCDVYGDYQNFSLYKIDTFNMTPDEVKTSILKE